MKSQSMMSLSAWLLAVLVVPLTAAAQDTEHHTTLATTRYTVTDLATLSGGTFQPTILHQQGWSSEWLVESRGWHTARRSLAGRTDGDIGAPGLGGPNSVAFGDNERFQAAGEAETSTPDPHARWQQR